MSRTERRISKDLFLTNNGELVPFSPTQPIELYVNTVRYYFPNQESKLYSTLAEAAKSINRTSARASQLYNDGKIQCLRIWSEGIEIQEGEQFKHLVNGYYISNHGRVLRVSQSRYTTLRYKILNPRSTMNGHLQLNCDLARAAGLRTSLIAPTVLELFSEPRPSEDAVCIHANGVSTDNRLCNLYWGTRTDAAQNREVFGHGIHLSKEKIPVKVVEDSRTHKLKPFIGRVFESISEAGRCIGVSPMAVRQYIIAGKIVKVNA